MAQKGIGDYIHYSWAGFKYCGLDEPGGDAKDVRGDIKAASAFDNQFSFAKQGFNYFHKQPNLQKIENQLNEFYLMQTGQGNKLDIDLQQPQLDEIQEAVETLLADKLNGVAVDFNTITAASKNNNLNYYISAEMEKSLEIFNNLRQYKKTSLSQTWSRVQSIKNRINTLIAYRDSLKNESSQDVSELSSHLDKIETEWRALQQEASNFSQSGKTFLVKNSIRNRNFINELENLIKMITTRAAAQIHGEYAEAIVAALSHIATANTLVSSRELLEYLKSGVLTGQKTVQKGLFSINFSPNINLENVTQGTKYGSANSKNEIGQISTQLVQDKVDVIYTIDGLDVPTTIKNYNMQNMAFPTIHLHSGTSLLQMIQQYTDFANYYLNVITTHGSGKDSNLINQAVLAMKMTMLLHALEGGFQILVNGKQLTSPAASVLIINDNFSQKFKVFSTTQILNNVSQNIEMLDIGKEDSITSFSNKYVGTTRSITDAYTRIEKLLMQLQRVKLDIGINKKIFDFN